MYTRIHAPLYTCYFRPGNVRLAQQQSAEVMCRCPQALLNKLTVNGLMPDEATDRQGNCGIDAFARSLMAFTRSFTGHSTSARNQRNLKNNTDKATLVRHEGVSWCQCVVPRG